MRGLRPPTHSKRRPSKPNRNIASGLAGRGLCGFLGLFGLFGLSAAGGCDADEALPPTSVSDVAQRREPVPAVRRIHGGVGPFAMAGWVMGQHALKELRVENPRFDVEVVHASPAQVQYSCIADGLQAATGASLGKLNLRRLDSEQTVSVIRNRATGKARAYRLKPDFLKRFSELPKEELREAAEMVSRIPSDEIFRVEMVDFDELLEKLEPGGAVRGRSSLDIDGLAREPISKEEK